MFIALLLCMLWPVQESTITLLRNELNEQVRGEMRRAWSKSQNGNTNNEFVVFVYRRADGTLFGELQATKSEFQIATFHFRASVVIIMHTHSNSARAQPSSLDKATAKRWHVPIVTLSRFGMYLYDPVTNTTVEVQKGLTWLDSDKKERK
jgi:hypothetical protein